MTAYSARPTSTNALNQLVNLVGHGFTVGQIVIYDGAWVLAQADTEAHCAGSWMVSIVPSPDTFYVTQTGYVLKTTNIADVGKQFYLSPSSAGNLTLTKPTTVGNVVLPCFVADSTTTGFFYGGSGRLIEAETIFSWNVVTTTPINMTVNNGYFANGGAPTTFVLPATYAKGDEFIIVDHSGNGFTITQTLGGLSQQVFDLGLASSAGVGGTTTTTIAGQTITLVAVAANGALRVISNKGAFVYA